MENTDVLASIYLHLASDVEPELAKARGEIASFDAWMAGLGGKSLAPASVAATDGVTAQKAALSAVDAEAARVAASVKGLEASLSASAIKTADAETEAAIRSADSRIASSQRALVQIARDYESQQVAADRAAEAAIAASDKETAAAIASADKQIATAQRLQLAVAREYERIGAAAEAAAAKQDAALTKVGKSAGLLGLGIIGVAGVSVDMAAKFQAAMERVHTQAGATQQEVDQLTPKILALSRVTGTGPEELAMSLYHVESAGFRGAQALDMVKLAAEGAKVGNADLESTTQAVIGVMASHVNGIHNATDAMGFLNATVGAGDMKMQQLDMGIATGILPAFHNFGLGAIDAGAALATLTDNVTPADEAATRLRMTVALLGAPSAAASKALQAIGLSASEANAALAHRDELAQYGVHVTDLAADMRKPNGLLVALEDLKSHLVDSGLTATEQGAVISKAFGGGRSSGAIETLLGELDRLKAKYGDISAGWQKFNADFQKTQETTAYQAAQADASAKALGITLGTTLLPAANDVLTTSSNIAGATTTWMNNNRELSGDIEKLVLGAGGLLILSATLLKVRDGWRLVGDAAKAAGILEEGASLGPLALIAGFGVGTAIIVQKLGDIQAAHKKTSDSMRQMYIDGKVTLDQYAASLGDLNTGRYATANSTVAAALAEAKAAKETHDHTLLLDSERKTLDVLGNTLGKVPGLWDSATAAKKRYYQFDGKNVPGSSSDPSAPTGPSATAPANYLNTQISDAQKKMDAAANQVAYDTNVLHTTVQAHIDELHRTTAAYTALTQEQYNLVGGMKYTGAAIKDGLDPFTRSLQAAKDRMTEAQNAYAADLASRGQVTAAEQRNLDTTTAAYKRLQGALDVATGLAQTREQKAQAAQDAWTAREQKAADTAAAKFDKWVDSVAAKQEALADAAEKAYVNLLKIASVRLSKPGAEGAESAARVGYYNQANQAPPGVPQPSDYKSEGAWEAAQAAYFKKHAIDFYHNNPTALGSTSGQELKIEGLTPAQLLADPTVKTYLETLTDKKLKALGFSPSQIASIPGTDAYNSKQSAGLYKELSGAPDNNPGKGPAPVVPGAIHGVGDAWSTFVPTVKDAIQTFSDLKAGFLAGTVSLNDYVTAGNAATAETNQQTILTAKADSQMGNHISALSALTPLYLTGAVSLRDLVTEGQAAAQQTADNNQKMIMYDVSMGDFTGAATLAKQAMLDGKMSVEDYVTIQKLANTETAHQNDLLMQSDIKLGDWSGALSLAKTAFDNGTMSFEQYVGILQQGNAAQAKQTQADWDAAYAAGDAATRMTMLSQSVSGLISRASTIAGAQNSVDQADLAIIAANSNLMVAGITAETTQLTDLAGVISASSAVQTAIGNGTLARLNDQIPIINDLYQITQATSPQALKVAQDALAIDRLTSEKDAAVNAWQVKVAADGARTAMDKLNSDRATAAAHGATLMAQLVVQQDARAIALANQAISIDQLQGLDLIHSDLSGVTAFTDKVQQDLANLAQAQQQSKQDSLTLAMAQSNENLVTAMGQQLQASDALQQAADTASMNSVSQSFDTSIASLKVQQAKDNVALQQLQSKGNASLQQLVDQGAEIRDSLDAIFSQGEQMIQGLGSENISNLDPRQITSSLYAQQRASNKTSAA